MLKYGKEGIKKERHASVDVRSGLDNSLPVYRKEQIVQDSLSSRRKLTDGDFLSCCTKKGSFMTNNYTVIGTCQSEEGSEEDNQKKNSQISDLAHLSLAWEHRR